jgi:hypothetical protein
MRGAILLGLVDWLSNRLPANEKNRFYAKLPPQALNTMTARGVINQSPIEATSFGRICDTYMELWGLEGPLGFHAMAGNIAVSDRRGYMRNLMQVGNASFVLSVTAARRGVVEGGGVPGVV